MNMAAVGRDSAGPTTLAIARPYVFTSIMASRWNDGRGMAIVRGYPARWRLPVVV